MDKNIKIYKRYDKYCFTVNKFSSIRHSHLTKHASSEYRYAWEAQRDARKIAKDHEYHLKVLEKFAIEDLSKPVIEDVAAERKLADHYEEIYDGLVDIASGMDEEDENQKKVNYFEAKAVVQEILFVIEKIPEDELADEEEQEESESRLNKIIDKIRDLVQKHYSKELEKDKKESKEKGNALPEAPMGGEMGMEDPMGGMGDPMGGMGDPMGGGMGMPTASTDSFIKIAQRIDIPDDDLIDEIMKDYGEKACSAIENKHRGCTFAKNKHGIDILENNDIILSLDIGDDLFLEGVRPCGKLEKMYPYQSSKFYQAYWKPIVEKVGHCCVGDNSNVLHVGGNSLPDIPKESSFKSPSFMTVNKKTKEPIPFVVSFKGDPQAWFVKESPLTKSAGSRYSKEDYYKNGKGAIVVCTDPTLQGYYQNTGHVVQVVPFEDHLEVDINFGNHICRMVEEQFEILDEL
jgi:hypothetical protein